MKDWIQKNHPEYSNILNECQSSDKSMPAHMRAVTIASRGGLLDSRRRWWIVVIVDGGFVKSLFVNAFFFFLFERAD